MIFTTDKWFDSQNVLYRGKSKLTAGTWALLPKTIVVILKRHSSVPYKQIAIILILHETIKIVFFSGKRLWSKRKCFLSCHHYGMRVQLKQHENSHTNTCTYSACHSASEFSIMWILYFFQKFNNRLDMLPKARAEPTYPPSVDHMPGVIKPMPSADTTTQPVKLTESPDLIHTKTFIQVF